MALRAKLELRFAHVIDAEDFQLFIQSLEQVSEFRLAKLTFLDGNYGPTIEYSDIRSLEIHDTQTREIPLGQAGAFWSDWIDFSCKFTGDDAITETAHRVYVLAHEYFAPIKHPVLPV